LACAAGVCGWRGAVTIPGRLLLSPVDPSQPVPDHRVHKHRSEHLCCFRGFILGLYVASKDLSIFLLLRFGIILKKCLLYLLFFQKFFIAVSIAILTPKSLQMNYNFILQTQFPQQAWFRPWTWFPEGWSGQCRRRVDGWCWRRQGHKGMPGARGPWTSCWWGSRGSRSPSPSTVGRSSRLAPSSRQRWESNMGSLVLCFKHLHLLSHDFLLHSFLWCGRAIISTVSWQCHPHMWGTESKMSSLVLLIKKHFHFIFVFLVHVIRDCFMHCHFLIDK